MPFTHRLTGHYLIMGFGQGLIVSLFALLLLEKGLTLVTLGWAFGVYSLTTVALELPLGAWADRHSRLTLYRLSMLIASFGLAMLLLPLNTAGLFITLMIMGLARAIDSGTLSAWQVQQLETSGLSERMGFWIGLWQSCFAMGLALGAFSGGHLAAASAHLIEPHPAGFINVFLAVLLILSQWLSSRWLFREGESSASAERAKAPIAQAMRWSFRRPSLRLLLIVTGILGLLMANIEAFWQPWVASLISADAFPVFGTLASAYFVCAALGPIAFTLLGLTQRTAPELSALVLFLIVCPLLAVMSQANTLGGFALGYLSLMLFLSAAQVPLEIWLNREAPEKIRSTLHSLLSLALQGGGALAALVLSPMVGIWGIAPVWLGLALALPLLLLITWKVVFPAMTWRRG